MSDAKRIGQLPPEQRAAVEVAALRAVRGVLTDDNAALAAAIVEIVDGGAILVGGALAYLAAQFATSLERGYGSAEAALDELNANVAAALLARPES